MNLERGNVKAAIREFEEAISIDKNKKEMLNNVASVFAERGHINRAIEYYHRALKTDLNHFNARRNLGLLYEQLGDYSRAAFQYSKALELKPNNYETFLKYQEIKKKLSEKRENRASDKR